MNTIVKSYYQKLYDIASQRSDCDELGILPTHFIGERKDFKTGLPMFVGRDTLGLNQVKIPLILDYECDTIDWLTDDGYYARSPFWSVLGRSLANLRKVPYGPSVFRNFYWSDLYKINFRAKKGTTQGLRTAQINDCAQLLLAEMDDLNPMSVVFFTGNDEQKGLHRFLERWEPLGQMKSKLNNGKFSLVGNAGIEHRCLVVPHPQGKSQDAIVERINDFFAKR